MLKSILSKKIAVIIAIFVFMGAMFVTTVKATEDLENTIKSLEIMREEITQILVESPNGGTAEELGAENLDYNKDGQINETDLSAIDLKIEELQAQLQNEEENEPTDLTETDGEGEEEPEIENPVTDARSVKLNTKIKVTGKLYRLKLLSAIVSLFNREKEQYVEKAELENQEVIVTDITRRSKGYIGVGYVPEGKKIPTTGYIKFDECEVTEVGKYMELTFNMEDGASCVLKINGNKYPITSNTKVELVDGGAKIDGNVILIEDGKTIELLNVNGQVGVSVSGTMGGTASGTVKVADKVTFGGNGNISFTGQGVTFGGDASLNGTSIGEGQMTVEYTGNSEDPFTVTVSKASVVGNDITSTANSIVQKIIEVIMKLIKSLVLMLSK